MDILEKPDLAVVQIPENPDYYYPFTAGSFANFGTAGASGDGTASVPAPTSVIDRFAAANNAMDFNGTNNEITLTTDILTVGGTVASFSFWAWDIGGGGNPPILARYNTPVSGLDQFYITTVAGKPRIFFSSTNVNYRAYESVKAFSFTEPTNVTVTVDLATQQFKFFVNGKDAGSVLVVAVGSAVTSFLSSVVPYQIGVLTPIGPANFADAKIDDLRIYNGIKITAKQAVALYRENKYKY